VSRARRLKLPQFLADLGQPPSALAALVAASVALFAVGLDPRVFSAGTPNAQAALRERPQLESLFLLAAVAEAAFLLVGGILGDTIGRRRVLLGGLAALALFEAGAMLTNEGPLFYACRIGAVASVGLVLPVSLATVAVAYNGITRATALGMAYAALGMGTAVAPAVLAALSPTVGRWPSFLLAIGAITVALVLGWRSVPKTEPSSLRRRDVYPHALWAFGLIAVVAGTIGFRATSESLVRVGLIVLGVVLLGVFLLLQRRRRGMSEDAAIDVRPTTVALFAGIVLAIAQVAPMLELPLFFQIAQQYAPLVATIAIAPFIVATIVAGPVAGALLARYSPRTLIAGGLAVVGLGDLLLGQATPSTNYIFFILPFFAVGAGFVVGTSVRTAVIFASTPRRLPSTAAALNQTSLVVGAQVGVAGITALVGAAAISSFTGGMPAGAETGGAVDAFRTFMLAIGTTEFGGIVGGLSATDVTQYGAAFAAGVQAALTIVGLGSLISAAICWLAMGSPEPVNSIWEMREERQPAA
jgi:MFS transporter, DHA2 family, multidrug resistance protein